MLPITQPVVNVGRYFSLAGHCLAPLYGNLSRPTVATIHKQAGQSVAVDPCELIAADGRKVGAKDKLRLIVNGCDRARKARVDSDEKSCLPVGYGV